MKRLVVLVWMGMSISVFGQQTHEKDSIFTPIIPIEKQDILKNLDLIVLTRYGFDSFLEDSKFANSNFNGNELRIDLSAKLHEKVGLRFRKRFTNAFTLGTLDHMNSSVDIAFIDIQATSKVNVTIGKLSADWGGYEYDLNPIEVLTYNDILNHAENYLVGAGVGYKHNKKHRFTVQVLNASANKLEENGVYTLPSEIKNTKLPLAFVGNWRGDFFGNKFQTSYSYSYFSQAKKKGMYYIALGNKYQSNQLTWMYDVQYRKDAIDTCGIISEMFSSDEPQLAQKTSYLEHWTRIDYKLFSKLHLSLTLMTSNAYIKNISTRIDEISHLRTSYGVIPMMQYSPFKKIDLRFYAAYIGRWYNYSSYAKEYLNQKNYNTGCISVGFIAPLKLL
ncbi:porin [Myroides odoratus]|uniref:porin n=1 Tax=Myroides odoratus TaxID=256 RepID=UPI0039B119C8